MRDPIDAYSDADLVALEHRAYRESARAWSEYRAACDRPARTADELTVREMLRESAATGQAFWQHVNTVRRERGLSLDGGAA